MDFQPTQPPHSAAWTIFTQVNFSLIAIAVVVGLVNLSGDLWMRGFFAIGILALVAATVTLTKTMRDLHESKRTVNKVEEAKMERFLLEHDPTRV